MGKCLVTKLNSVVDNKELLGIGEVSIGLTQSMLYPQYNAITIVYSNEDGYIRLKEGNLSFTHKGNAVTLPLTLNKEYTYDFKFTGNGNIVLKNKYALRKLYLEGDCVIDLNALKYSKMMEYLRVNSKAYGSISDVLAMTELKELMLDLNNITGDIQEITNLPKIGYIRLINRNSISLDVSKLSGKCTYFSASRGLNKCSWKTERATDSYVMILKDINLGNDVDAMLINQAKCEKTSTYNGTEISVVGTRTSASDAAVATLQQKGYTVSVTPA